MRTLCWAFALVILGGAAVHAAGFEPVTPVKQYTGSVDDESLIAGKPPVAVITTAADWEKLWKDWKLNGDVPTVDFGKNFAVVNTTRGGRLTMTLRKDDKGDLQVLGLATRDLRPGFRYALAVVAREGIRTVQGKDLPAPKKD